MFGRQTDLLHPLGSASTPAFDEVVLDSEEVKDAACRVIDDLFNRVGTVIEGGNGWHHNRSDLDGAYQQLCVSEVQGCLARKQNQAPTLLECHVGGPEKKIVAI